MPAHMKYYHVIIHAWCLFEVKSTATECDAVGVSHLLTHLYSPGGLGYGVYHYEPVGMVVGEEIVKW